MAREPTTCGALNAVQERNSLALAHATMCQKKHVFLKLGNTIAQTSQMH